MFKFKGKKYRLEMDCGNAPCPRCDLFNYDRCALEDNKIGYPCNTEHIMKLDESDEDEEHQQVASPPIPPEQPARQYTYNMLSGTIETEESKAKHLEYEVFMRGYRYALGVEEGDTESN